MGEVYEDLSGFINMHGYDIISLGYDRYNSEKFIELYTQDHGDYGLEKVIQGARTESVPLGQLKNLAENRSLIFDQELMKFAMGNAIAIQDNNGNYKLSKKRADEKIDNVSALMDAWVAYNLHKEVFD
jgi:phage terminase large subunit-like protein